VRECHLLGISEARRELAGGWGRSSASIDLYEISGIESETTTRGNVMPKGMNDAEVFYTLYGQIIQTVPFYADKFVRVSDESTADLQVVR